MGGGMRYGEPAPNDNTIMDYEVLASLRRHRGSLACGAGVPTRLGGQQPCLAATLLPAELRRTAFRSDAGCRTGDPALLADFRQVEQNFRDLDRQVREHIAGREGGKGDVLEQVFGERDAIADSNQGRSFRAFWEFLMSTARQEELTNLLERVFVLDSVAELAPDARMKRIHYDWLNAGEATQRTIARLSEQLRRYLDDQAWLGKAPRHRRHSRQPWDCRICHLQNLKDREEFESHALRRASHVKSQNTGDTFSSPQ